MLNNFIGGGQVFLHKIRMFWQVFIKTIHIAICLGIILVGFMHSNALKQLDWQAFLSYRKAVVANSFDGAIHELRQMLGNKPYYVTLVNAATKNGIWAANIAPQKIIKSHIFKQANVEAMVLGKLILLWAGAITLLGFLVIFLLWSQFGSFLKTEKTKSGTNQVLTAKEVTKALRKIGRMSDLKIGDMPLVKNMETMNFLVSGSIGSGKTNLMHNLLPQVESRGEAAIVIDNTGEMIAKYYNPKRGDIIFNPFDQRSQSWDFWQDCKQKKDLEKFADILIGFNSRKNHRGANDFWEESAQSIFVAFAEIFKNQKKQSIKVLYKMLCRSESKAMYDMLKGTNAAKYFTKDNAKTAASIVSVLMANIKPLRFLQEEDDNGNGKFSITEYINQVNEGGKGWLFLATDPSARELTIPLNAALLELFISRMRRTRINPKNKIWIVMDELPSLGKLPTLPQLMQEGRKYGSCVISGLQSTSQLYQHYGESEASNLIGLFKTKFAFSSDDPRMGELYSKLSGSKTIISQQKNTSFGASELRDGVSYNERSEKSPLVSYEEFAKLKIGECYVILPETSARIAKIQLPEAKLADKNQWFIEHENEEFKNFDNRVLDQEDNNLIDEELLVATNDVDKESHKQQDKKQSLIHDEILLFE